MNINLNCPICKGRVAQVNSQNLLGLLDSSLYQCLECALMFRTPLPTEEQLSKYYDKVPSKRYGTKQQLKMASNQLKWLTGALVENGLIAEKKFNFIEIGAGEGWLTKTAERSDFILSSLGYEADSKSVEWGKSHLGANLVNEYYNFDQSVEGEDENQKIISLIHVLEHFIDPINFLNCIQRSKTETFLYIEVPNVVYERDFLENDVYSWGASGQHLWSFSPKSLRILFENLGFKVLKLEVVGNKKFWIPITETLKVIRAYDETHQRFRQTGGGNLRIMRSSLKLLLLSTWVAFKNQFRKVNRADLPSIRVLVVNKSDY